MIGAKGTEYIGECAHRESIGKYGGNIWYTVHHHIGDIERY